MNNNLDVKSAFNTIYCIIVKLVIFEEKGKLGENDVNTVFNHLRKVDNVLQVFF